ncbi:MAG: cytochrome c [Acidobacteria bacterium]|nr:cytochrome c [Acidobacteriota bacterium]
MRLVVLLFVAVAGTAGAHEFFSTKVTWTREISRIVAKRCLGCHSEGGKAFSLASFAAARPWAKAIKEEVLSRRMPPWGAAKGFGDFAGDQALSQEEISLIADWVEGGAPEGDRLLLPPMKPPPVPANLSKPQIKFRQLPASQDKPLSSPIRIEGIVPAKGVEAGTQLTALKPDGTMEPLIWIVEPRAASGRRFPLLEPVLLPKGTRLIQRGPGAFSLLIEP